MSVEVKYDVTNNSKHAKEPKQPTIDSAGYDLFASESKTLLLHDVTTITLELLLEIPDDYFGKIYPRSGLLAKHFVNYDAGVIDSGYRGVVLVLMTNHSDKPLFIKEGFRIAQLVIHKKENIVLNKFLQNFWSQDSEQATVLVQQVFNSFSYLIKMSSGEVDHGKELFFECYKIIENMHSLGNLFCHCYQCHGCPSLKNFLKEEKRYCSICVFQDSFNLWELNEIKRDRVKLNNYSSEILKVCCEAKKTCAFEEILGW